MKSGRSKPSLNERLKQKVDRAAEDRADLLVTQLKSFSVDIEKHVQIAKNTIVDDIEQLVEGTSRKLTAVQMHNEAWTEKTVRATEMIKAARLDWIQQGLASILIPMMIGSACSAVMGVLVASIYFWQTPEPVSPSVTPTSPIVETVRGLGGLGQVVRHPPGSEVVPCPLRSASESVCVKLPRENR